MMTGKEPAPSGSAAVAGAPPRPLASLPLRAPCEGAPTGPAALGDGAPNRPGKGGLTPALSGYGEPPDVPPRTSAIASTGCTEGVTSGVAPRELPFLSLSFCG